MRIFFVPLFCLLTIVVAAQLPKKHSYNDYQQPHPFQTAYEHGFESIEADIFLRNGKLLVAHDSAGLKQERSLEDLYLTPLSKSIQANKGHVYTDSEASLQMLIDIKTEAKATLSALIQLLRRYPNIIQCPTLSIVISGNRPKENEYSAYPSFIYFDGRPDKEYDEKTLKKNNLDQWRLPPICPLERSGLPAI